jgi:hypothetical protein
MNRMFLCYLATRVSQVPQLESKSRLDPRDPEPSDPVGPHLHFRSHRNNEGVAPTKLGLVGRMLERGEIPSVP